MSRSKFHAHLDICKRCDGEPFNLCAEGDRLLRDAVGEHMAGAFRALDASCVAELARELALAMYDMASAELKPGEITFVPTPLADHVELLPPKYVRYLGSALAQGDGDPGYDDEPWGRA